MPRDKTAAIVVARMTSSRLPGKTLMPLAGKPVIAHTLDRLRQCTELNEVILAFTDRPEDDVLERFCREHGLAYSRGSEQDVLGRVLQSAEAHDVDTILYVCGDCPCACPELASDLLRFFRAGGYDYASNCQEIRYPLGLNLEVFSRAALRRVATLTQNPWDREHVTEYFYTHEQVFRCGFVAAPEELTRPDYRLCVDLPADLEVMGALFSGLGNGSGLFSAAELVHYLDAHPHLAAANQDLKHRKFRAAVIGLGQAGLRYDLHATDGVLRSHSFAYLKHSRTKLDCACDPSTEARALFTASTQIAEVYDDPERMLGERAPEIVSICAPTGAHAALLRMVASHGGVAAIFCEKPLAASPEEVREVMELCRERGVSLFLNYWMRHAETYRNLKAFLDSGGLGAVTNVLYTYSRGLLNSGSHAVNLLQFLFGRPESVQASRVLDAGLAEPNIEGVLTFQSGPSVSLLCPDWRHYFTSEQHFFGETGVLRVECNGQRITHLAARESPSFPGIRDLAPHEPPFAALLGQPLTRALDEIIAHLDSGAPVTLAAAEEECSVLDALFALRRSASEGFRPVSLLP